MKKVNPVLEKKRKEGFRQGYDTGVIHGQNQAKAFFLHWIGDLTVIPGIGEKRARDIANHFIQEYGTDKPNE